MTSVSGPSFPMITDARNVRTVTTFDAVAEVMRAQSAGRRLRNDPIDDATVLDLLELAAHANADGRRRSEFVRKQKGSRVPGG